MLDRDLTVVSVDGRKGTLQITDNEDRRISVADFPPVVEYELWENWDCSDDD